MQDFADSNFQEPKRRASDLIGTQPSGETLLHLLRGILQRLEEIERCQMDIKTAFLQNELHKPDFDGHRQAHRSMVEAAKVVQGYKHDITATFVKWAAGVLLSALMLGIGAWMSGNVK